MFTDCEKRELIKSLAMGMSFDEISDIYGEHKTEVEEEIKFQKQKRGG